MGEIVSEVKCNINAKEGIVTIDNQAMVFHCNHFNRNLQATIENCRHIDNKKILINSAAEVTFLGLMQHFVENMDMTTSQRLEYAESVYKYCGFGLLPLSQVEMENFDLTISHSHYGRALALNFEKRHQAGEYFDLGFAIGALSASFMQPFNGSLSKNSISKGNSTTTIHIKKSEDFRYLFELDLYNEYKAESKGITAEIPARITGDNIDEDTIISAVSQAPLFGNEQGLIPAFGVELTRHYADYYNLISFHFEQQLTKKLEQRPALTDLIVYDYPALFYYQQYIDMEGMALSRTLLIESGHICGFNTMGGIMNSDVWDNLIMPMIKTHEDWLHGIIAAINALGWGIWRVIELVAGEKLVLRVYRPYESLGYLRKFGLADHPVDYLVAGVGASLMNLLYEGDITKKPTLDLDYYHKVNRSKTSFWSEQSACVAMGDDYSEICVTRMKRG